MLEAVEVFQALRHPLRRHLLEQLPVHGELSRDLLEQSASECDVNISRHIAALVQAGLVSVRKSGRTFYYSRRGDSLNELQELLSELARPPSAEGTSGIESLLPGSAFRRARVGERPAVRRGDAPTPLVGRAAKF
jgi:DNA-binding transcriptional ArsR family regulator